MKVFIKHLRFEKRFGRDIGFCSLYDETDKQIMNGSLAQCVQFSKDNELEIVNSQEVLEFLISLGFAS